MGNAYAKKDYFIKLIFHNKDKWMLVLIKLGGLRW